MKPLKITFIIIVTTLLLIACSEDNKNNLAPNALTKNYMEKVKQLEIMKITQAKDRTPNKKYTKMLENIVGKDFSNRQLNRQFSRPTNLVYKYFINNYKDNYDALIIDIGNAKIDGTRAKVSAYIGSDECQFSYSNKKGQWLLSALSCTRYQY